MDSIDLLPACIPAFERAQIGYFVTGSVASALYGEHRYTNDVDVIVHLEAEDADIVLSRAGVLPQPRSGWTGHRSRRHVQRDTPQLGIQDRLRGFGPERTRSCRFRSGAPAAAGIGLGGAARVARGRGREQAQFLQAGGSDKHIRDIAGILRVLGGEVDRAYIDHWAARLGLEEQWAIARARADDPSY